MTLKNRIEQVRLFETAESPAERDALLFGAFREGQLGLTQVRLDSIRHAPGVLYERARFAAQVLFEALIEIRLPQDEIAAQFTVDNLAALVNEEWNNPRNHTETLRGVIKVIHEKELKRLRQMFNFSDLSAPQLFRETLHHEDIPLYIGNLYNARRFWKGFKPSNEDFLANISIPLRIKYFDALLLGIYWADGSLGRGKGILTIDGKQGDLNERRNVGMYKDLVAHLLKSIHNYGPVSADSYIKERRTKMGIAYHPSFEINSAAICTWLANDLGYPLTQDRYAHKRVPFEHLLGVEAKQGFFAGLITGLSKINEWGSLLFEHGDRTFIGDIAELSTRIGYSPSEIERRDTTKFGNKPMKHPMWWFTVSQRDVVRMLNTDSKTALPHIGMFYNPQQYDRVQVHEIL